MTELVRYLVDLDIVSVYTSARPPFALVDRVGIGGVKEKEETDLPASKMLSFRIDDAIAADLEAVAEVDRVAVAEEVRRAIELLLASRRKDPAFRQRVMEAVARSQRLLAELGDPEAAAALSLENEPMPAVRAARRHH